MEIIARGSPSDPQWLPLATRKRTLIPNEPRMEWAPAIMRAALDRWKKERPDAVLRSASSVYNCMGMVFGSRRTTIDIDQLRMILVEDGYRKLESRYQVKIGDLVVYSRNQHGYQHVGIVAEFHFELKTTSPQFIVLSKWGPEGEYFHPIDYVPTMYGYPVEYWTDRREIP